MATQLLEDTFLRQYARTPLQLEREIGAGGEGRVYSIVGEHSLVAKLYYHPDEEHMTKLSLMLMNPPRISKTGQNEIIWPVDGIMNEQGQFVGFLMPLLDKKRNVSLSQIYNPGSRISTAPEFTWKNLLSTAANIATILVALHAANYVVGDLNESNILIHKKSGKVKLIDCDSMQVPGPDGKTFRCSVGKAEYTPPELQGMAFDEVDRLPMHDNFALAVLIFLLLMEGVHPFSGSLPASDTIPLPEDNIRNGQWPYAPDSSLQLPRHALSLDILPPGLQELMQRCFQQSTNAQRPTAQEWLDALNQTQLKGCHKNKRHWYSDHLYICPWCERKELLGFDSFAHPLYRRSFQGRPNKRRWTARLFPRVHPRPRTNVSNRKRSLTGRIFGFALSLLVVVGCSIAVNAVIPRNSINTLTPSTFSAPTYSAPTNNNFLPTEPLTCPADEIGIPPNCRPIFSTVTPLPLPTLTTNLCIVPATKTGKDECTPVVIPIPTLTKAK